MFDPRKDDTLLGGLVVVRKEAPPEVWDPGKPGRDRPPVTAGQPFLRGSDSLDAILNAAFEQVEALRPRAENPDFRTLILFPTGNPINSYQFNPATVRYPASSRVHLYVLGTQIDPTWKKLFEKNGRTVRFYRNLSVIEDNLTYDVKNDLNPTAPR